MRFTAAIYIYIYISFISGIFARTLRLWVCICVCIYVVEMFLHFTRIFTSLLFFSLNPSCKKRYTCWSQIHTCTRHQPQWWTYLIVYTVVVFFSRIYSKSMRRKAIILGICFEKSIILFSMYWPHGNICKWIISIPMERNVATVFRGYGICSR